MKPGSKSLWLWLVLLRVSLTHVRAAPKVVRPARATTCCRA